MRTRIVLPSDLEPHEAPEYQALRDRMFSREEAVQMIRRNRSKRLAEAYYEVGEVLLRKRKK